MKNRLIATLLILSTISIFATSLIEKPSKTELLAHLKQVKANIESNLKDLGDDITPDTIFYIKLMDEFFNRAEVLKKILIYKYVKPQFKFICNCLLTLEELPLAEYTHVKHYDNKGRWTGGSTNIPNARINLNINLMAELRELFFAIYTEHHIQYCQNNHHGRYATEITKKEIDELFETVLDNICYDYCTYDTCPLLEMIDAKIAQLEAQA